MKFVHLVLNLVCQTTSYGANHSRTRSCHPCYGGEITEENSETVRESDAILREEIAKAGLDRDIWQYFTVNTGVRSVGVMGDGRTYDLRLPFVLSLLSTE